LKRAERTGLLINMRNYACDVPVLAMCKRVPALRTCNSNVIQTCQVTSWECQWTLNTGPSNPFTALYERRHNIERIPINIEINFFFW